MKRWLPSALFLFALIVRLIAQTATQFDGLYGQDPFAYYDYAVDLHNALAANQLPPPFFWPIGYPLLINAAMLLVGVRPFAAQLISIISGAAIAPLVYWLVLTYKKDAHVGAVVAGLLTGSAAQLLISSLSIMADAASLFGATLSAWAMLRYLQRLQLSYLALAAATLAFALLTRWVYALLVIPWGLSALFAWRTARLDWQQIGKSVATAVTIGLLILGAHFALDLQRETLSYVGDLQVYTWHPANAFKSTLTNSDGTFHYERPMGLFYATPILHPAYIFPLFALFYRPALAWLRHQSKAKIALLLGWPLTIYLFLAGVPWQNWRFPLSFFPPLLVLVGLGVDWLWQQRPSWHKATITLCTLALLGSLAWAGRDLINFTTWKQSHLATAAWVNEQLPPDTTLIAFGLTFTLQHYTDIATQDLSILDEAALAELSRQNNNLYLLIDPDNIQSQWQDKQQGINVRWLDEHTDLLQIGRSGAFVLYWVGPKQPATFGSTPLLVAPINNAPRPHPTRLQPRCGPLGHSRPAKPGLRPGPGLRSRSV
jgi:4-amino-4-deoxy-L-arabinose transferase-like glycosyltransferase